MRASTFAASPRLTAALCLASMVCPAADWKKLGTQAIVCGGGALFGRTLGEKLAEIEAKKLKLSGTKAREHRRAIMLGTAAALCASSALLAGTIYEGMSERDRKKREEEHEAAMAVAGPNTRDFVLPDSQTRMTLKTEASEREGDMECRFQVETAGERGEPARVKRCRSGENQPWKVKY